MRNLFSKKLYIDGLKKQMRFSITAVCIFSAICLFYAVAIVIDFPSDQNTAATQLVVCSFLHLVPLFSPFLLLSQFKFIYKRNSSDYHLSLPFKRQAICTSYFAATFTWIAAIILVPTVITSIICVIFTSSPLQISAIATITFGYILCAFIMMSVMLVALSAMNSSISAVLFYFLCAFSFRIILLIITLIISLTAPVLNLEYIFGGYLDPSFFLPVGLSFTWGNVMLSYGFIYAFWSADLIWSLFSNTSAMIYSLLIGIAAFIVGHIVFCKRKAENSNNISLPPIINNICRCIAPSLFCIVAVSVILWEDDLLSSFDLYKYSPFIFFIFIVLSVFCFYFYEFVTTKSFSGFRKATPYLFGVAALTVSFFLGIGAVQWTANSFRPTPDKVESVRFCDGINKIYSNNPSDYEDGIISTINFTDETIISAACNDLCMYLDYPSISNVSDNTVTVEFNMKNGTTVYRSISLKSSDYQFLRTNIAKNQACIDATIDLPSKEIIQSVYFRSNTYELFHEFTKEETAKLWNIFATEYASLPEEEKIIIKSIDYSNFFAYGYFTVNVNANDLSSKSFYCITSNTPESAQYLFSLINADEVFSLIHEELDAAYEDPYNIEPWCLTLKIAPLSELLNDTPDYSNWDFVADFEVNNSGSLETVSSMMTVLDDSADNAILSETYSATLILIDRSGQTHNAFFSISQETYETLTNNYREYNTVVPNVFYCI